MKLGTLLFVVLVPAFAVGCHKPTEYETEIEITRLSVVRRDEAKSPITTDMEISYAECPGEQSEVVRGGKEFSACIAKHKVGDRVKAKLTHALTNEGRWDYTVTEIAGCDRPGDPNDEASTKVVRDCEDWKVNGVVVGFECRYADKNHLNKKCPWFRQH